jgi:hypothetical protein
VRFNQVQPRIRQVLYTHTFVSFVHTSEYDYRVNPILSSGACIYVLDFIVKQTWKFL